MKVIFIFMANLLVLPLAQITAQLTVSSPPLFMFYFFNALLFSQEIIMMWSSPFRNWIKKSFEDKKGKPESKQIISSYLSLWCVRLFAHGKLVEVYYNHQPFENDTYFQLILIILVLVGGVIVGNGAEALLRKAFKGD